MAALTVTAAQVAYVSGALALDQVAGEAFAAGAAVYKAANQTWLKAQCDGTAAEAGSYDCGIALASADAAGARVSVAVAGPVAGQGAIVNLGAGAAAGASLIYGPGRTAGSLVPSADWASGDLVTPLALGLGSNKVQLFRAYNALSVKP